MVSQDGKSSSGSPVKSASQRQCGINHSFQERTDNLHGRSNLREISHAGLPPARLLALFRITRGHLRGVVELLLCGQTPDFVPAEHLHKCLSAIATAKMMNGYESFRQIRQRAPDRGSVFLNVDN